MAEEIYKQIEVQFSVPFKDEEPGDRLQLQQRQEYFTGINSEKRVSRTN
jgi:hypothetical protein